MRLSYEGFLTWTDEDMLAEWVDGEVVMTIPASICWKSVEKPTPAAGSNGCASRAFCQSGSLQSSLDTQPLRKDRTSMAKTQNTRYIPEIVELLKPIDPEKVIVFGSEASGAATAASDLDLMVVTKSDKLPANYREKEEMYLSVARLLRDIKRSVPVDLIVHTHAMHVRFIELDSQFAREVLQKGVVVYESDHA